MLTKLWGCMLYTGDESSAAFIELQHAWLITTFVRLKHAWLTKCVKVKHAPLHAATMKLTSLPSMLQVAAAGGLQKSCAVMKQYLQELVGDVHEALFPVCTKLVHAVATKASNLLPANPALQERLHFCI